MNYTAEEVMNYLINVFFEIDWEFMRENEMTLDEILSLVSIRHALWELGYYKFIHRRSR